VETYKAYKVHKAYKEKNKITKSSSIFLLLHGTNTIRLMGRGLAVSQNVYFDQKENERLGGVNFF